MKKIFLLFILLLLVGCNETVKMEEKTFAFTDVILKIIVMGQGATSEVKRRTFEHADDIDRIKNAMQILTEYHTDEGPLYKLEVIYENGWKDLIDVWYYEKLTVAASFKSRQSFEQTHRLKI